MDNGVTCTNCETFVPYRLVVSDENGNEGRLLAKCTRGINPITLQKCKFFWWKGPRRGSRSRSGPRRGSHSRSRSPSYPTSSQLRTPTSSPRAAPQLNLISADAEGNPSIEGNTDQQDGSATGQHKCPTAGCLSRRINRKCRRGRCLTHCKAAGGCSIPTHYVPPLSGRRNRSPSLTLPTTSQSLLPRPASTSNPSIPAVPSPSAVGPAPLESQGSLDAQPNPRYVSHMPPIFTQQWATEERLRETQRRADAERLESIKKSKQTVLVYAWVKDDTEPNVIEFQDGFSWPHFVVCPTVCYMLELPEKGVKLYRENHGIWVTIQERHVVTVQEGQRVFLKAPGVTRCQDLDRCMRVPERIHIRDNLPGEQEDVVKKTLAKRSSIIATSKSTPALAVTVKPVPITTSRSAPLSLRQSTTTAAPHRQPPNAIASSSRLQPNTRGMLTSLSTKLSLVSARPMKRSRMPEVINLVDSDSGSELAYTYPHHASPVVKRERERGSVTIKPQSQIHDVINLVDSDSDFDPPHTRRPYASPVIKTDPGSVNVKWEASKAEASEDPHIHLLSDESIDEPLPPLWPADFYAIDISNFFADYDGRRDVQKMFERIFKGVAYHHSTYNDHKQRWKIAPPSAKEKARAAGRTKSGLWSAFMRHNPAKNAAVKSARRKLARAGKAPMKVAESDELSWPSSSDM